MKLERIALYFMSQERGERGRVKKGKDSERGSS